MSTAERLITITHTIRDMLEELDFSPPVHTVYDPLLYAAAPYEAYLTRFARSEKRVLFLGMNPGPWGMAQTGVPFGEIEAVSGWMGIEEPVEKPADEHPKRPIEGFSCSRSEVSGRRLWGLIKKRFGTAERFFADHFVANYCPLVFIEESGRNRTPDKLPAAERDRLFRLCDLLLLRTVEVLRPSRLVGIGKFAEKRLHAAIDRSDERASRSVEKIVSITHPSPANPRANRGWEEPVVKTLTDAGVWNASPDGQP